MHSLSYGHMGGMWLQTNFAPGSRMVNWGCSDRIVSKEMYCVACHISGVSGESRLSRSGCSGSF